jgi:hypothetical protein
VFRLLRLLLVLGGLGAIVWFGAKVPLGQRTLFEHIQAIWKTHESQDLVRGTKDRVSHLVDRAAGRAVTEVAKNAPNQAAAHRAPTDQELAATAPPMENVEAKDRQALRGLIEQRRTK